MSDQVKQFLIANWNAIAIFTYTVALLLSLTFIDQTLEALSSKPLHLFLFVLRIAIASAAFVIAASTPALPVAVPAVVLGFALLTLSPPRRRP